MTSSRRASNSPKWLNTTWPPRSQVKPAGSTTDEACPPAVAERSKSSQSSWPFRTSSRAQASPHGPAPMMTIDMSRGIGMRGSILGGRNSRRTGVDTGPGCRRPRSSETFDTLAKIGETEVFQRGEVELRAASRPSCRAWTPGHGGRRRGRVREHLLVLGATAALQDGDADGHAHEYTDSDRHADSDQHARRRPTRRRARRLRPTRRRPTDTPTPTNTPTPTDTPTSTPTPTNTPTAHEHADADDRRRLRPTRRVGTPTPTPADHRRRSATA